MTSYDKWTVVPHIKLFLLFPLFFLPLFSGWLLKPGACSPTRAKDSPDPIFSLQDQSRAPHALARTPPWGDACASAAASLALNEILNTGLGNQ